MSLVTRHSAFTLLELLVVVGIVSLLLVVVIPAVNSLSKSGGRKGAISNLISTIEQARSQALSGGKNTYVAFARALPGTATPQMVQDYSYRAYAVFEDDSAAANKVQLTKWQKLPTGISFRSQAETNGTGTCLTSIANNTKAAFSFTPLGGTLDCPYIQFDSIGAVVQPTSVAPMRIVVFEGNVSGDKENATAYESSGEPVRDEIQVAKFTGRAAYVTR